MEEIIKSIEPALTLLIPGFIATNIYYYFSDHPKPLQFERIIQALILTSILKLAVSLIEKLAFWIGSHYSLGVWNNDTALATAVALSIFTGLALAYLSNNDFIYRLMRKLGITSKSSYVDNWNFAFRQRTDQAIALQLKDGRRIMGYPHAWADKQADHFLLVKCAWIHCSPPVTIDYSDGFLICASEVAWVEFLVSNQEGSNHD